MAIGSVFDWPLVCNLLNLLFLSAVGGAIGVERRGKGVEQSVGVPEAATTGLREADGGKKKRRHRNGKKKKGKAVI